MEQRRLRLGDILDDYCPRERRVTNHAIVAMIEEDVKQTRCTTCDAEHAYKGGKAPRRRKKETPGALYKEVLAAMPEVEGVPAPAVAAAAHMPITAVDDLEDDVDDVDTETFDAPVFIAADAAPANAVDAAPLADVADVEPAGVPAALEDGPVHRPLIRATLPRTGEHKIERQIPDFTIRHTNGRGNGHFRGGDPRMRARPHGPHGGGANGNGNRPPGRFAGSRPGAPGRPGARGASPSGFRSGPPRAGGGRKRSR